MFDSRKNEENTVIMMLNTFVCLLLSSHDSPAALANGMEVEILRGFQDLNAKIVFAGERRCQTFCNLVFWFKIFSLRRIFSLFEEIATFVDAFLTH